MGITFEAGEIEAESTQSVASGGSEQVQVQVQEATQGEQVQDQPAKVETQDQEAASESQEQLPESSSPCSEEASEGSPTPETATTSPFEQGNPDKSVKTSEFSHLHFMATVMWKDACESKSQDVGKLALDAARAKAIAKAAKDEFDEAVDELQKLVDGGYQKFLPGSEVDDDDARQENGGNDCGASPVVHASHGDDSAHHAGNDDPAAAGEVAATKWEDRSVIELIGFGAPKSTIEKLIELGHDTIGRFERLRADIANHREKWPKGIGEAKVTKLEDAIVAWGTKNWSVEQSPPAAVESSDGHPEAPIESSVEALAVPESPTLESDVASTDDESTPQTLPEKPKKARAPRKKKAKDGEQSEHESEELPALAAPATPTDPQDTLEINGTAVPSIGQWDKADNRDRVLWMQARSKTLQEKKADGSFAPSFPGEIVKGKMAAERGDSIAVGAIMQPGERLDSWLYGFSQSSQGASQKGSSVDKQAVKTPTLTDADISEL